MNTIKYMNTQYTVKDITKHESSGTIVITGIFKDDAIVDVLQIRYHGGMKKTSISYQNIMFPKHILN